MNAPDPTEIPAALAESSPIPAPAISRVIAAIGSRTNVCFRIFFANGASYQNHDGMPAVSVTFNTRGAELRTILFGHVGLLEAYFDGSVDIDGDIALVFRAGLDAGFDLQPNALVAVRNRWHEWRFSNRSPAQARANARFHYGLGRAFYEQWLDRNALVYTCGYWREGTKTIEEAQRNKMDHVCRKVQLSRGDSFVDIGCGWGGLLFHAWEHYGARGTGINNTTEQVNELRDDIARRGLHEQVRVIEADFRNVTEQYDKLLSIGTLEHAGRDQLFDVVRAHAQCLKPGGLGLIHFIGHVGSFDTDFYIRKHIFPGGWIPSLSQALDAMERCGLEIVDVENLRRHYALTLDAWAESFDQRWSAIHALDPARFDERFRRKWRTYLWACAEMFRSQNSRTHLFQITVSKGNIGANYPMSRAFLYAPKT